MIQSEHFGKEQYQMIIAVVWYHKIDSTEQKRKIQKKYFIFCSSYLTHSSLFFQKCYNLFRVHMSMLMPMNWTAEIILFDGSGQQFKNRNNFYWCLQLSQNAAI